MIGPDKGDGSLEEAQRLVDKFGLAEQVSFAGKVKKGDIGSWMNRGDIFLNTANVDNSPMTVLEAMACGLCVVSTNPGGIPYFLEDGQDALLVPPRDPDAMAQAIYRLMIEPDLAVRISRNARMKAERFDWSIILPQWEAILAAVASTSGLCDVSLGNDIRTPFA
jgi:glycosyltransferase involved in cell wall biosynthesis